MAFLQIYLRMEVLSLVEKLLELLESIWASETLPVDPRDATIMVIFKQGIMADCRNYHGITLLSIAGKILAKLVSYRLAELAERWLLENQYGCRPN